ncbi:hypothetical protein C8J56DRAFT_1063414 [Mycena floridula]|nr:hypothetical protein C8J56DRAFT_1063414 [Mycena floridula]
MPFRANSQFSEELEHRAGGNLEPGLANLVASGHFWDHHYGNVCPPGMDLRPDPSPLTMRAHYNGLPYSVMRRSPSPPTPVLGYNTLPLPTLRDLTPSPELDRALPPVHALFPEPLPETRTPLSSIKVDANFGVTPPSVLTAPQKKGVDDETHKLIRQSFSKPAVGGKGIFHGPVLIELCHIAVGHNIYMTPHGQKSAAWEAVKNDLLKSQVGACMPRDLKAQAVRHKVDGLVAYKKDPDSQDTHAKSVASTLKDGGYEITIQSIVECLETQYDEAKYKSDGAKEIAKKLTNETEAGGELIRNASMRKFIKRTRSDEPVVGSSSTSKAVTVKTDDEGDERAAKHRRSGIRREGSGSSSTGRLIKIIEEDMQSRKEYQERAEKQAEAAQKQAAQVVDLLGSFLAR